jgi:hypothetical protein
MKKLLFVAICVAGIVAGNAQGTVNFSNAGLAGVTLDGASAPVGTTVDLVSGGAVVGSANLIAPGIFVGGTITVDGVTGTGSFTISSGGTSSAAFDIALGGTGVPPGPPGSLANFGGLALTSGGVDPGPDPVVPEPSTIALGALGAALLFFRRRK